MHVLMSRPCAAQAHFQPQHPPTHAGQWTAAGFRTEVHAVAFLLASPGLRPASPPCPSCGTQPLPAAQSFLPGVRYDTIRFIALTLRTDWYKSKSGWLDYLNLPGVQEENTFYSGY